MSTPVTVTYAPRKHGPVAYATSHRSVLLEAQDLANTSGLPATVYHATLAPWASATATTHCWCARVDGQEFPPLPDTGAIWAAVGTVVAPVVHPHNVGGSKRPLASGKRMDGEVMRVLHAKDGSTVRVVQTAEGYVVERERADAGVVIHWGPVQTVRQISNSGTTWDPVVTRAQVEAEYLCARLNAEHDAAQDEATLALLTQG